MNDDKLFWYLLSGAAVAALVGGVAVHATRDATQQSPELTPYESNVLGEALSYVNTWLPRDRPGDPRYDDYVRSHVDRMSTGGAKARIWAYYQKHYVP